MKYTVMMMFGILSVNNAFADRADTAISDARNKIKQEVCSSEVQNTPSSTDKAAYEAALGHVQIAVVNAFNWSMDGRFGNEEQTKLLNFGKEIRSNVLLPMLPAASGGVAAACEYFNNKSVSAPTDLSNSGIIQ